MPHSSASATPRDSGLRNDVRTKHSLRLARDFGRKQWGDEGYAQEELVAELGAPFLCSHLELATEPREENASCIAN